MVAGIFKLSDQSFCLILAAVSGILKFQAIPRFLVRYDIYLPTHTITAIHKWAGLVLAASALTHLVLHWRWLIRTTKTLLENKPAGVAKGTRTK